MVYNMVYNKKKYMFIDCSCYPEASGNTGLLVVKFWGRIKSYMQISVGAGGCP